MEKIRKMKVDDYKAMIKLWESTEGVGINEYDDSKKGIKKFLKRNPKTCFVAETAEKEIIGTIMGGYDGRRGLIYHLMVKAEYRNKGFGKKLLDRVEKAFVKNGIMKTYIVTFVTNETGNKFWENNGYSIRDTLNFMSKKIV